MATADVTAALEIFHPLYEQSGAADGFVSLEVSPRLAYDTEGTIKDARTLPRTHRHAQPAGQNPGHRGRAYPPSAR